MKISFEIHLLDVAIILAAIVAIELCRSRKKRSLRISIGGTSKMNFSLKAGAAYLIGLFPQTNGQDDTSAIVNSSTVTSDPFDPNGPFVRQAVAGETLVSGEGTITAVGGEWVADLLNASTGQEMLVTANMNATFEDGDANMTSQARVTVTLGAPTHTVRIQVG